MTDVPVLAFRPVRGDFAVTAFRVLNALAIRLTRRPIDVRPIQRPSGAGARGNRVVLCVVDVLVELHCEVGREAEQQRQPDVIENAG